MTRYDNFLFLHSAYIRVRDVSFYKDIDDQIDSLKNLIEGQQEFTKNDEEALYLLIQENWKRALRDICESTITRINSRKTRGETFYDIIESIRRLNIKSQNNLNLDDYHAIFKQIQGNIDKMDEKITVERFNLVIAGLGVLIGFLLGVIASIIGYFILKGMNWL
jgi:hypothetical protein